MQNMQKENDPFLAHYQEYKDRLFNYLMYRLQFDRAQAEDLLMDIILKAYKNFASFDPAKGSFKTWIFTLAHNHLVNFWRDRGSRAADSLEALEEKGITPSVEPEDLVSGQIEGEKVRHVLSLMPEGEREVVVLRYLEDLDYPEIARILDKKEGAIRTSLSRALGRFETIYKKLYLAKGKLNKSA